MRRLILAGVAATVTVSVVAGGVFTAFMFATPDPTPDPTPDAVADGGSCVDRIVRTVATIESGGRYNLPAGPGGASGGLQMIQSTWQGYARQAGVDVALWPEAWQAPSDVQDRVAASVIGTFIRTHPVEDVPVLWYFPAALGDPTLMDVVPFPQFNTLTPREYQTRWVAQYQKTGGCSPTGTAAPVPVGDLNQPEPDLAGYPNGEIPEQMLVEIAPGRLLAPLTAAAWRAMASAATADGVTLTVNSAYRTRTYQAELVARLGPISEGGLAAPAGASPHGLGLAVDIEVTDPVVLGWLRSHARTWCWVNAAPAREPWHFQRIPDCTTGG